MIKRNLTCVPSPNVPPKKYYEANFSLNAVSNSTENNVQVEKFPVQFTFDNKTYNYEGHIAYPKESKDKRKLPLVLVFPNYAGEKEFDVGVAVFLAKLGYVALSVDLYGDTLVYPRHLRAPTPSFTKDKLIAHVKGSFTSMNFLLKNPIFWRGLQSKYLAKARAHHRVHPKHCGAIGYCFGGQCVLEMVRSSDIVDCVVSFHGLLQSDPLKEPIDFRTMEKVPLSFDIENHYSGNPTVLIESGVLDHLVTENNIKIFKEEMGNAGLNYRITEHGPNVDHGFALSPAVWSNKYNEDADRRSTQSMLALFYETWPDYAPNLQNANTNACGTKLQHIPFLQRPINSNL